MQSAYHFMTIDYNENNNDKGGAKASPRDLNQYDIICPILGPKQTIFQ